MKNYFRNYMLVGLTIGTLTFAGSISAYAESNQVDSPKGNITSDATAQKFRDGGKKIRSFDYSNLVKEGVIDQATADKMSAYMDLKNSERQAEMEKMKAMTETERQAYFESNKGKQKTDHIAEMVTNGIITQEQSDAIKIAMPQPTKDKENLGSKAGKMDYSSLVTSGVISQETADKISAYMTLKNSERKSEMEKMKAMTEAERKAYFESNKDKQRTDKFAEMVADGIITQAEADAIKAAIPTKSGKSIDN